MHQTRQARWLLRWGLTVLWAAAVIPAYAQPPANPVAPTAIEGVASTTIEIAVGTAQTYQMASKKRIARVENERDTVALIQAILTDPTRVAITGLQVGLTKVKFTDIDGKEEIIGILVRLDVDLIKALIKRTVPTANVDVIPISGSTNTQPILALAGNVKQIDDVDTILRIASSVLGSGPDRIINGMTVGGVQQVQLDVVVASVERTEQRRIGFDFLRNGQFTIGTTTAGQTQIANANLSFLGIGEIGSLSPNPAAGAPGANTNIVFGQVSSNFIGFLQALREEGLAKFLAEPKIVTMSGRPAQFRAGGQQVLPTVSGFGGVAGAEFRDFGTEIRVLPIVRGNGKIYIEVQPSTSFPEGIPVLVGNTLVQGRRDVVVNTSVEMEDGQTFAVGGLIQSRVVANTRKTPILGDLPYIGPLFGRVDHQEIENELLVLVTPHLVDAMDCKQLPTTMLTRSTRNPDDYELFLEMILEAPRGQRQVFQNKKYVPAYKNDPTANQFPCGVTGHPMHGGMGGCANGACMSGGCASGTCGSAPMITANVMPTSMMPTPAVTNSVVPAAATMLPVNKEVKEVPVVADAPAPQMPAGELPGTPAMPMSLPN